MEKRRQETINGTLTMIGRGIDYTINLLVGNPATPPQNVRK